MAFGATTLTKTLSGRGGGGMPPSLVTGPALAATGVSGMYLLYRLYRRSEERARGGRSALSSSRPFSAGVGGGGGPDDLASLILKAEKGGGDGGGGPERGCVYLDYNGTTPVHPLVLAAMIPFLSSHFGNPSSGHAYGTVPREAVQRGRRSIYGLLAQSPKKVEEGDFDFDRTAQESIIFTGCGTESDNMAIHLALESTRHQFSGEGEGEGKRKKRKKPHVVTCNVEHPAVSECLSSLESRGDIDVTYVPVNSEGICPSPSVISAVIGRLDDTVLVTLMLANNESGALQPVREVSEYCRENGVLFHTDAAQAAGKVSVRLDDTGYPDMVTLVGHKIGAPKGVAALYVRPGCLSENGRRIPDGYGSAGMLLLGGGQEGGRRAGTENVPYIAGMGKAADLLTDNDQWKKNAARMEMLRSRLLDGLRSRLCPKFGDDAVRPNGPSDPSLRLPNTLSVGLRGVQSGELLNAVSSRVAASAGSACHASGGGISAVLRAMHVPTEYAAGTLRLSVGPTTTEEEVDRAAEILADEAERQLSSSSGVGVEGK